MTDRQTVYGISSQIRIWSLQQTPVSPFVVGNESLDLVLHFLICKKYAFDPCYLGKMTRDEKPHRQNRREQGTVSVNSQPAKHPEDQKLLMNG